MQAQKDNEDKALDLKLGSQPASRPRPFLCPLRARGIVQTTHAEYPLRQKIQMAPPRQIARAPPRQIARAPPRQIARASSHFFWYCTIRPF